MGTDESSDVQGGVGRLMRQQEELWTDAAAVQHYAAALPAEEFGAVWWDNERDPVAFVLAVTARADDHVVALRRLVAHPQRVDVVQVRCSERALRSLQDEIEALFGEYPISMVGPDARNGVVVVGLRRDDEDVRAELRRRFGDAIRIEPGTSRAYAL